MSMRKMLTLLVCLMAVLSLFISCAVEQTDDLATVRLSIDSERSRSIAPEGNKGVNEVKKYKFSFLVDSVSEYVFQMDKEGTGTYNMTGIKPGLYTLFAEALNQEGMTVATYREEVKLKRGSNTFSISFTELAETSVGAISLSVIHNPSEYTDTVTVTATVEKLGDVNKEIRITSEDADGKTTSTGTISNLPIGSYRLCIQGKVGSKIMFGINEVVIVAPGKTTNVSHDFSGSVATSSMNVTDTLITPLEGNLTIKETSVYGNVNMTLNITSELPESIYKDSEGNIKDIQVSFFLEDYNITNKTVKYNPSGTSITVETGAFFGPAIYSAIFYLTGSDESLGSVEVKADYDINTGKITSQTTLNTTP